MAADAVLKGLVVDELRSATDIGEERSRAQLQQACGVGSNDLDQILVELQAAGTVTEQIPDGLTLVQSTPDGAGQPPPEPQEEEEASGVPTWVAEVPPWEPPALEHAAPLASLDSAADVTRVSLSLVVAAALDLETLGKMFAAGVAEANVKGGRFVFEVSP